MTDLILQHLPKILTGLSTLLGLGLFKGLATWYRTYHKQARKDDAQDAQHRSDRVSEQSKRIDDLLDRMTKIEKKQEEERKARVEAEVKNKQLRATIDAMSDKIDTLVAMVSDLRKEAGMKALSEEEKDELREHPDFTSSDSSDSNEQ